MRALSLLLLLLCTTGTILGQSGSAGGSASGSGSGAGSGAPSACAQTCIEGSLANAVQSGCNSGDLTCACAKPDFGFGVRDCANEACPASEVQAAISYAASLCQSALSSTGTTSSASPSSSGTAPQTTSVAASTTNSNGNSTPTQASTGGSGSPTGSASSPTTTASADSKNGGGGGGGGGGDNTSTKIAIGVGTGVGVFALIGAAIAIWYARRSKKQKAEIRALREQQALNDERKDAQFLDGNPRSELQTVERPIEMGKPGAYVDGNDAPRGGSYVNATPVEIGHGR